MSDYTTLVVWVRKQSIVLADGADDADFLNFQISSEESRKD